MPTSNPFQLQLQLNGVQPVITHYGFDGQSWLHPTARSGFFAVTVNSVLYTAHDLALQTVREQIPAAGVRQITASYSGPGFVVDQHIVLYEDTALIETWPVVHCSGPQACRVTRIDSFDLNLPAADYSLHYYKGGWGNEFEPVFGPLQAEVILEADAGRSSRKFHPWFALYRGNESVLSGSIAWSGNWDFRFQPLTEGGWRISGGLLERAFAKELQPGQSLEAPRMVLVLGHDLNAVSQQYAEVGRRHWYPNNALSQQLPIEWNHWWPYEDAEINEQVFAANVDRAADLGIEICTLDAGWFGPSDPETFWEHSRGDWNLVNDRRFPHGIRPLAERAHARGMRFGIWCEIEGLGSEAQLAKDHPEYVATRAGKSLGGVCFGNPQVQEWALQTLSRLVTEYQADWIKLDYNLDAGLGCDRSDHGHQPGDGLYEHVRGYYRMLERLRATFPELVLESCSSGGLRIDLGLMRQTFMTFLSDPDWPVHDLQIFWGGSTMLAAERLLHWSYCDWRHDPPHPKQTFNPHDPALTQKQFDYYTRIAMLGAYGLSQKLPNLPEWIAQRLILHHQVYKENVRRFVQQGRLYRLTGQPRRTGEGNRLCAFQYSLGTQHLLFAFRMPGAAADPNVRLFDLQPEHTYRLEGFEGEFSAQMTGRELMENGLNLSLLDEEESLLVQIG